MQNSAWGTLWGEEGGGAPASTSRKMDQDVGPSQDSSVQVFFLGIFLGQEFPWFLLRRFVGVEMHSTDLPATPTPARQVTVPQHQGRLRPWV